MINIKKIFLSIIIFVFFTTEGSAIIKDSLFATVGNKAVTRSDILEEIKILLILNALSYSEADKEQLERSAIRAVIKRNIKQIEIERHNFTEFNMKDLNLQVNAHAEKLNMDLEALKNIFETNKIDFSKVVTNIKTELLWNGLIFKLYKNRLSVNQEEVEEHLKSIQEKDESYEYLVSEIVIEKVPSDQIQMKIEEVKSKIENDGFENTAKVISISETGVEGGDLGWVNQNILSDELKTKITNTPVGSISEPVMLHDGILIFKIRDKRKVKKYTNLVEAKNQIIKFEKTKILNMYSMSHYDNLQRSIPIKYY